MDKEIGEVLGTSKKLRLDDPPPWFTKFVETVEKEKASIAGEVVPKKELKENAKQIAQDQWADPGVRDRIHSEVDNHQARLFHQIFGGKRKL